MPRTIASGGSSADPSVAVTGESSAEGVPYQMMHSEGRIVGWKLQEILPGRRANVDVLTGSGKRLEDTHTKLVQLIRKHDEMSSILGSVGRGWARRTTWTSRVVEALGDEPVDRTDPPIGRLIDETLESRIVAAAQGAG